MARHYDARYRTYRHAHRSHEAPVATAGRGADEAVSRWTGRRDRGRLRLRHRRRRHGRLRARQPPDARIPRTRVLLLEAGGRDQLPLDPHPGRLPLLHRQPAHRLDDADRGRARPERPLARLSARQGARRLLLDQRHDLHARPGGRLRRLAPARQRRLGLGRRAALLPPIRGQLPRRDARCTAPAASGRSRGSGCAGTSSRRSATRPRRSASPRRDDFNDGDNEGSGFFEVNQRERHPLDDGEGLPAPGAQAPEPARRHRRARDRADARRQARHRRALSRSDGAERAAARRGRGAPRGRRDQLAEAPGALRHRRPGRARREHRHRRRATRCPASARICRTTCRSAPSSASPAPGR